MKTKIMTLFLGVCSWLATSAQTTQVVDLSTGVVNGSTTLIAPYTYDDTWQVTIPGGSGFNPVSCTNGCLIDSWGSIYCSTWASDTHVRWLSPYLDGSGNAQKANVNGNYTYRMTFTAASCTPTGATLTLTRFGADDSFAAISVNGHSHTQTATFNPLSGPATISVGSEIVPGTNTITITVNNLDQSYTGLLVYGNLTITYPGDPNITPLITGASTFCAGDMLSFTGSTGSATATGHYWELTECTSAGTTVPGGYTWSHSYTGAPGAFTFPISLVTCGKYFRVKLAVANYCISWVETTKVIFLSCLPVANAGPDVTVCQGDCATIGGIPGHEHGISYQWITNVGHSIALVGTTAQITVCPTKATSTYTLTVTNSSGCTATDVVTVNMQNNDPAFGLSSNLNPGDPYFTLNATPVINPLPAGASFTWFVDEIVSTSNTTVISGSSATSSPCWTSTLNCNFNGYDGPLFNNSGNVTNPMTNACTSPSVGRFTVDHTYRITRGTSSPVCPWAQSSQIIYRTHNLMGGDEIHFMDDPNAPDYSHYVTTSAPSIENTLADPLTVYPNPGSGVFTITANTAGSGVIEVYDVLGNKIQVIVLKNNTENYKLDLTGYSKGIYMLNMTSGDQRYSKKIIVE